MAGDLSVLEPKVESNVGLSVVPIRVALVPTIMMDAKTTGVNEGVAMSVCLVRDRRRDLGVRDGFVGQGNVSCEIIVLDSDLRCAFARNWCRSWSTMFLYCPLSGPF